MTCFGIAELAFNWTERRVKVKALTAQTLIGGF